MLRRRLGDLALALLAVVTLALAGYALVRDPSPSSAATALPVRPTVTATATASPASPRPAPALIPTLLLAAPGVQAGPVTVAGSMLRWQLGSLLVVPVDRAALEPALAKQQLVVVQAADAGDAAPLVAAVRAVRAAAPVVRMIIVGPLGLDGQQHVAQRDALRTVATEVEADFIDPVGSGWAAKRLAPSSDGSLTPGDQQLLGQLLVNAGRGAEKARALASASPR